MAPISWHFCWTSLVPTWHHRIRFSQGNMTRAAKDAIKTCGAQLIDSWDSHRWRRCWMSMVWGEIIIGWTYMGYLNVDPIYSNIYWYIYIDPIWSYKCFDNFKYLILRLCMDIYWMFTFKSVQSSVMMEFAPCEFTSDIKMSCGSHSTLFLQNSTSACRNPDVLWIRLEFIYFRSHMLVFPLFGGGIQFLSLNHSGRLTSAGCLCQTLWNTIWIGASIQSSNPSTISLNCNVIASSYCLVLSSLGSRLL